MKQFPNITQKIILRYQDKILITRHKNGSFDFPGGRLEWKEGLFDSLQRELKEELNFQLEYQPRLFHVWNYISKDGKRHSVMIYYFYELKKRHKFISPAGIKILWLTKEEMKQTIKDRDFVEHMFSWSNKKSPYSMFYCN